MLAVYIQALERKMWWCLYYLLEQQKIEFRIYSSNKFLQSSYYSFSSSIFSRVSSLFVISCNRTGELDSMSLKRSENEATLSSSHVFFFFSFYLSMSLIPCNLVQYQNHDIDRLLLAIQSHCTFVFLHLTMELK